MTYTEFLINEIKDTEAGNPIFVSDLAVRLAEEFKLNTEKSKVATSTAMSRILSKNLIPLLRFYKKGIYYITRNTPFGETEIEKEYLIQRKYYQNNSGYDTGYSLLHWLGLTTQMPRDRVIATNSVKTSIRWDKEFQIYVRAPKTKINAENKAYLQLLDALELLDKAPVDDETPYLKLLKFVNRNTLSYQKLLSLAVQFYSPKTIIEIANIAREDGDNNAFA